MIREGWHTKDIHVKRLDDHLPWEITVSTQWPTLLHNVFNPQHPVLIAGLPFYTQRLSQERGRWVVKLGQLLPVNRPRQYGASPGQAPA